jgi:hypothetical protein
MLSSQFFLGPPSATFPRDFATNIPYVFLVFPIPPKCAILRTLTYFTILTTPDGLRFLLFWGLTQHSFAVSYRSYLTLRDGTDRWSRKVGKYKVKLRNVPEERRSHVPRNVSLKLPADLLRNAIPHYVINILAT